VAVSVTAMAVWLWIFTTIASATVSGVLGYYLGTLI
jgi:hypothetical protein